MSDYGWPWYPLGARSVIASKTFPDLINSFAKRVKSGMKALVVKVEYIANHDEAKKPVMKLQVPKSLLRRTADESHEAQQTHLNQLPTRVELEPLHMSASDEETLPQALIFPNIHALTARVLLLLKLGECVRKLSDASRHPYNMTRLDLRSANPGTPANRISSWYRVRMESLVSRTPERSSRRPCDTSELSVLPRAHPEPRGDTRAARMH